MSRSSSPYSAPSGALLPLEDVHASLLRDPLQGQRGHGGDGDTLREGYRAASLTSAGPSPAGPSSSPHTAHTPPPVVTSATADFQRSLVQQQLQQTQKEVRRLKEELYETSGRLSQTTTKLNEQKVEYGALTHRYANAIEKLTSAEGDVKRLEEQLVQERTRANGVRADADTLRHQLRSANEESARLQRQLSELEANRGLDQREVQRLLEDRSQYMPTVEVRRMQAELRDTQQRLVDRLTRALDGLAVTQEEGETNLFVARSAVLSAGTDLDARLLRAEAALDHLRTHVREYHDGLEKETNDFLLALMAENKELWQHLTQLQADHDVALSELALQRRRGESVPADQHQYVQRQLENMTERLNKAQQVMAAQTALAREHEREMKELLAANAALEEQLAQLRQRLAKEEEDSKGKSGALHEADAALKDATQQIRGLQEALVTERAAADDTLRKLTETQNAMQSEFEQRLRTVQSERSSLEEQLASTGKALEDSQARVTALEREVTSKTQSFEAYKFKTEEAAARQQQMQETDMAEAQQAMERELAQLHERLAEAENEARAAVRERDDSRAEAQTLRVTVKTLEAELARERADADSVEKQRAEAQERLRAALAECDELKSQCGTSGLTTKELERQIERLKKEKADLAQQLKDEAARGQQRYEQAQRDWRTSEKARTSLQEELKLLRTRIAEMETARLSSDRNMQDREHLMKENLRLHEQYTVIQQENAALSDELKALRSRHQSTSHLTQQLQDLQQRLRELPQLRQATDEARREALKAREETEMLRKERDDMAAKLDYFLEESKAAAQMDAEFDRVVRDAGEAVQRLGGQVQSAKTRGTSSSQGPFTGAGRSAPSSSPYGATPPSASGLSPALHGSTSPFALSSSPQRPPQQRSPGSGSRMARDAAVLTREAEAFDRSSRSTPQRAWKG